MTKADLGVALICKDGEHTLGPCLASIRDYVKQIVVCVDVRTTDKTKKVAKKYGAEVHDVRVSEEHTCDQHGTIWAQHFARARTESFRHLDSSLEWWMWLDADDVVPNAAHLPELLGRIDPHYVAIWLPYVYSTIEGRSNTEFHRERILRTRVLDEDSVRPQAWEWRHRVHEVIAPVPDGPMYGSDQIKVVHQENTHKSESSATRNLTLLEIDLEENPNDSRVIFYVGNQYFALQEWQKAAAWYERLLALRHENVYERWQTAIYLSMAYERLGNIEAATQSAFCAMDDAPWHPEPYYRLAALNLAAGRFDHVEFWTDLGRTKTKKPPFFVFKNELDYTFNNRICLADALSQQGRLDEAETELKEALAVLPDPAVEKALKNMAQQKVLLDKANAFVGAARAGLNGEALHSLYEQQDTDVRGIGQVRNIVMPSLLASRPDTQPRVVFWCGRSVEEWAPPKLNETGIGGSETAVVEIASRFANDGFRVDVYNGAGRYEGVHHGVGYWDPERYTDQRQHLFISWRQPVVPANPTSIASILWLHDLNYGAGARDAIQSWCRPDGRVLGVSQWHADYLKKMYELPEVSYAPNGIALERFRDLDIPRVPMRCAYTSSPDRGLIRLLQLWPKILDTEPSAELHIAYGWDNVDRLIALGGRGDLIGYKAAVQAEVEKHESVKWLGRIPQDELAKLYLSTYCWTYPTNFLEVSCISAMEAMAGGAVVVSNSAGALPETVGDAGILVKGIPGTRSWEAQYLPVLQGALADAKERYRYQLKGYERALQCTWDQAYANHWKPLVESMLTEAVL